MIKDLLYRIIVDDKNAIKRVNDFEKKWNNISKGANAVGKSFGNAFNNIANSGEKIFFAVEGFSRIAAPINNAIETMANFDKSIREIGTLLNDVTESDIQRMGKEVRQMAIEFGQQIDVMAKARYDTVSAGFTGMADSMEVMAAASKLAVGGVAQVSETTQVLTKLLNAYQLGAKDAADVTDVLFTTVRLGQTTIPELSQSLGNVASIANTAGLSVRGLGASMAVLTRRIDTPESVTALRGALYALAAPAVEAQAKMSELGISLQRFDDGTLDLISTIKQFQGLPIDTLRRVIPEARAANAVTILANNIGELEGALRDMNDAAGATETAFNKIADSPAFKLQKLKAQFTSAIISIGNALQILVDMVTVLADKFAAFDSSTQTLTLTIAGLGIAVAKFIPVLLTMSAGLGPVGIALGLVAAAAGFLIYKFSETETAAKNLNHIEFTALTNELGRLNDKQQLTNDEQQRRNTIIKTLREEYPEYLKNLDLEKTKTGELRDVQREVNREITERIKLKALEDELSESLQNATNAQKEYNQALREQGTAAELARQASKLRFDPAQLPDKLKADRDKATEFLNTLFGKTVITDATPAYEINAKLTQIYGENTRKAEELKTGIEALGETLKTETDKYKQYQNELTNLQNQLDKPGTQPVDGFKLENAPAGATFEERRKFIELQINAEIAKIKQVETLTEAHHKRIADLEQLKNERIAQINAQEQAQSSTKSLQQIELEKQLQKLKIDAISNEFEQKRQTINAEIDAEIAKVANVQKLTTDHQKVIAALEQKRIREIETVNATELEEKRKLNIDLQKLSADALTNEFDKRRAELEIWYAEEKLKYVGQTDALAALAIIRQNRLNAINQDQTTTTRTENVAVQRLQVQADPNQFNRQRAELEIWYAEETQKYAGQTDALAALAQIRAQRLTDIQIAETDNAWDAYVANGAAVFDTLAAANRTFWQTISDDAMSGAERTKQVFGAMKQAFLMNIGEMFQAEIAMITKSLFAHQTAEATKTAVTKQGVLARLGAMLAGIAKEIAAVAKSIGVWLAQAAAKLVSFFASLGPLGLLAGLGAIPALIAGARAVVKNVGFFAEGGIVQGPTLGMLGEAGSPEAAIPLNQRGSDFIASLLPKVTVVAPAPNADFGKFAKQIAAEIQNVKIEIHSALDAQRFLRNEMPKYNRNNDRRKL